VIIITIDRSLLEEIHTQPYLLLLIAALTIATFSLSPTVHPITSFLRKEKQAMKDKLSSVVIRRYESKDKVFIRELLSKGGLEPWTTALRHAWLGGGSSLAVMANWTVVSLVFYHLEVTSALLTITVWLGILSKTIYGLFLVDS